MADPLAQQLAELRDAGLDAQHEPQLALVATLLERAASHTGGVAERLRDRAARRLDALEDAVAEQRELAREALRASGARPRQAERVLERLGPLRARRLARRRRRRPAGEDPRRRDYHRQGRALSAVLGLDRARADDRGEAGLYNGPRMAARALEEAAALSPAYLHGLCARLDDWAALMSLPEPPRSRGR